MKVDLWTHVFQVTLLFLIGFVVALQWRGKEHKKEKLAFSCLMLLGWLIAMASLWFPNQPIILDALRSFYSPVGRFLEIK